MARDSNGMVINCGNWAVRIDSVLMTEAHAIKKTCELCVNLSLSKVIVEYDCKVLVDVLIGSVLLWLKM